MAKPKGKSVAKKGKGAAKSSGKGGGLLIFLTFMALVPFSLPTLLVMVVGMMPTLAAAVVERGSNRYAWICVGGLNFSGLVPWLFDLWFGHHTLDYALGQVTDVRMLLTAFGASGVGSLLYMATPPVIGTFTAMTSERRGVSLVATQRKLVELWGDGVITKGE